jgi:hypothetical protein
VISPFLSSLIVIVSPPMWRRSKLLLAASLVFLVVALPVGTVADAATKVFRYSPFTQAGEVKRSLTIVATYYGGNCHYGTYSARRDAWECFSGRYKFSVCFKRPSGSDLICAPDPRKQIAYRLVAPTFERQRSRPSKGFWLFLRVGHNFCHGIPGMSKVVNDRRANFRCSDSWTGDFIWGSIVRRNRTWRAVVGTDDPSTWRWQNVRQAWR